MPCPGPEAMDSSRLLIILCETENKALSILPKVHPKSGQEIQKAGILFIFWPSPLGLQAISCEPAALSGPPPSERSSEKKTSKMLLTAALAGGIASCVSTLALFPLDTLKTRMQSTAGATFASIARSAPNIGARGLYRSLSFPIQPPEQAKVVLACKLWT